MHVICGSKDVIHSWAIPGLNVKIDCIPGYNSHRRLLLRWRGAYWGQCMEVCGRYHHWMPIMVNVVHPALFLDWCLTFLRGLDSQAQNGANPLPAAEVTRLLKLLGD
jgi:cytochrome c oxidase subunit 2